MTHSRKSVISELRAYHRQTGQWAKNGVTSHLPTNRPELS
jgi:hypothetical protein